MDLQKLEDSTWIDKWKKAKDWDALVDLNTEFIELSAAGIQDVHTPYHLRPLDPESEELVPALLHLHEYGMLTTNSQPASASSCFSDEDEEWIDIRQIPFVEFFLRLDGTRPMHFLERLSRDRNLIITAVMHAHGVVVAPLPDGVTAIPLSFERVRPRMPQTNESAEWCVITATPGEPLSLDEFGFEDIPAVCNDLVVSCMVMPMHDGDLYKEEEDATFLQKLEVVDILASIADHAREAGLESTRKSSLAESGSQATTH
ncbi:hypothetical protein CT0861_10560 [Colletotrichum tofieldiae]|uniref:Uncharacterized protein n=1 Tax=Colletotrichum tofieldiae TaxID=708197 RepID=A0A166MGC7_9PEZI|nr:hypothetical protein CT0861_10560 [Colletotrichum tofieldiae]